MNDCVFAFISCCNCIAGRCSKYLSVNSAKGFKIQKDYSDSINPIIEKALEGKRNEIKIKFGIENG
jgi:hypothetical protein